MRLFTLEVRDLYYSAVVRMKNIQDSLNELGALIDDLKKQGDYAIDKWSK